MVTKLFIKKVREINFSIRTKEEAQDRIVKQMGKTEEEKQRAEYAIRRLNEDAQELRAERDNLIKGAFLAKGISKKDFCVLVADLTYSRVGDEIVKVDNFPV